MFAYIKGSLEQKSNNYVVIDVGGIGYKIFMATKAIETLGEIGKVVKVHTHYYVREDNINSIDLFTKDYKLIKEKDLLLFDKNKSILYFKPDDIEKYDMFIIDYLKNDSYAINFNYLKNSYEIDISSSNNTKVLYDSLSIQSDEKNATQVDNYKITNINGNMLGYIVLTQGDE